MPGGELGGWSIEAVEGGCGRLRIRLSRPGEAATLSVHPREGNPRRGPFDAGAFRVYTDASTILGAALSAAGRALAARIEPVPGGEARRVLRRWSRQAAQEGSPEIFDLGEDAAATLDELDELAPATTGAVVRGPLAVVASAPVLDRLARLSPPVPLEAVVEEYRDEASLAEALEPLAARALRLRLVFEPTAGSVGALRGLLLCALSPLPAGGERTRPSPVEAAWVHLPSIADYAARRLDPPRLSDVARALAAAHAAGTGHVELASRLGEPPCLSPRALRRALLEKRTPAIPSGPAGGGFAPGCAACAVRPSCRGLAPEYAQRLGTDELVPFPTASATGAPTWAEKARWLLAGWPGESVTLGELMEDSELPPWPCHLPWSRLELGDGGNPAGPCCASYQEGTRRDTFVPGSALAAPLGIRDQAETPDALWNGPRMQAFRREMTHPGPPSTCRRDCPVLLGGTHRPAAMILWGGPASSVESQIALVEDMAAGRTVARRPPQSLCVATTSYCNYDCIMCGFGEHGSLADEKPASFWKGLGTWLDALQQIDANGGEPLASPEFRAFLERADFAAHPQLGISLTTNLSYLTPAQLERFARVPFISFTVSLNAATAGTYARVMRGLSFEAIRVNLDTLLRRRAQDPSPPGVTYSFVVLKQNLDEVGAFYEMTKRDGVGVRFMLPEENRNDSSILTSREAMREARRALAEVASDLASRGLSDERARVWSSVLRLDERLASGVLAPL